MSIDENIRPDDNYSGSKLVLAIFGVAVAAGVLSWIYRYQAAHDSTQFWGPNFARLIAEPSKVTASRLTKEPSEASGDELQVLDDTYYRVDPRDVTSARGMVHLRHTILSDGNYNWGNPVTVDDWRWGLQFTDEDMSATVLFNEDFTILGRLNRRGDSVRTVDCLPMAETLREYFASAEIFDAAKGNPPPEY